MWDKALNDDEIKKYYSHDYPTREGDVKLNYDFTNVQDDIVMDSSGYGNHGIKKGGVIDSEKIGKISYTTLPFRNRPGRFFSQSHKRNDMVGGKWVHQHDTSINEKRFVEEVQGGMVNTDEDGLNNLSYSIEKSEYLFETKHQIFDFKCDCDIPNHVNLED